MALSKKHHEAIAAAIRAERCGPGSPAVETALDQVASRLADYFAADNPRFDRARFLAACGVE